MLSAKRMSVRVRFETPSLQAGWRTCEELIEALEKKQVQATQMDRDALTRRWKESVTKRDIISTETALLLCFEGLSLADALGQAPEDAYFAIIEKFLRKFEINRKLFTMYQSVTFAAASNNMVSHHGLALLSAALWQAYRLTGDLRYINAILKNISTSPLIRLRAEQVVAAL